MFSSLLMWLSIMTIFSIFVGHTTGEYTLTRSYNGQTFLDGFKHQGMNFDPTHGFVKYVDRPEALDAGLVDMDSNGSVYLGVDHKYSAPDGRRSVRVQSRDAFTWGLMVADIAHMPGTTCGTWPAFWLEPATGTWPQAGEIDIIEGANKQRYRASTVHIGPQHCKMDAIADLNLPSTVGRDDCYTVGGDSVGCPIYAKSETTYGDGYNAVGGGFEVLLWTPSEITMWFFPRTGQIPSTLRSTSPRPALLGKPLARWTFAQSECNLPSIAHDLQIVFNIEICGEWASGGWGDECAAETGYSTCEAFVVDNPSVFQGSFWKINSVKWFKDDGGAGLYGATAAGNGTFFQA